MNSKEIEALVEKFYEGLTTSSEELQLREFFSREDIPPHLALHADIFRFYETSGKEELTDPDFENRFLTAIDSTPTLKLKNRNIRYSILTGIAAAILLLFGMIFTFRNDIFTKTPKFSSDQEMAYRNAKNALAMVSANFNTGLDQANKLGDFQKGLQELQHLNTFQKGIDQMKKISEFYYYQPLIINQGDQPRP